MDADQTKLRRYNLWLGLLVIVLVALSFRLTVARYLANDDPDDGRAYARLATNMLDHRVYSDDEAEPYTPTLIRVPGYPIFLTVVYALGGHGDNTAVRVVHAIIDSLTCVIVGALAWLWMPDERRRWRAGLVAAAFAASCPFTAIYVATILSETVATFLAVALALTATLAMQSSTLRRAILWWVASGLLAGISVMVRPDSGLFAAGAGLTMVAVGFLSRHTGTAGEAVKRGLGWRFGRVMLWGTVFSLAFMVVLAPWTIRNKHVFGVFQPLSPFHAEAPGEFVTKGYFRWLRTWVDDEKYIEPAIWSLDDKKITVDMLPDQAFDSPEEKARVAALFDQYNNPPPEAPDEEAPAPPAGPTQTLPLPGTSPAAPKNANANTSADSDGSGDNDNSDSDNANDDNSNDDNSNDAADSDKDSGDDSGDNAEADTGHQSVEMTPAIDAGFAQIAAERIARNRLKFYAWMPAKRGFSLWFGTHSQYYPFAGELFPWSDLDHDAHQQIWLPLFAAITGIYTLIGLLGAFVLWRMRAARKWLLLVALMTIPRLLFFSTIENPEPRYVVELFAFASILGGIAVAYFWRIKKSNDLADGQPTVMP